MNKENYVHIRRDFIFDVKCHKCTTALPSNTAIIVRDKNGNEYPFGPKCARDTLDPDKTGLLKTIPDFTKAVLSEKSETKSSGSRGGSKRRGRSSKDSGMQEFRRAVTYLLLRQQKLAHIPKAACDGFHHIYNTYKQTHSLSEDAVVYLLNVEKKNRGTKHGLGSLQAVYAYDCYITHAIPKIEHPGGKCFLNNIQEEYLRKRLYLSEKQAQGAERWLQNNIPNHSPLNPSAFQWAWYYHF